MIVILVMINCSSSSRLSKEIDDCHKGKVPSWVREMAREIRSSKSKGEIVQYYYRDQFVFSIDPCGGCADAMTTVYDCDQREICRFGGIAGFLTCPDFAEHASQRKVILQGD